MALVPCSGRFECGLCRIDLCLGDCAFGNERCQCCVDARAAISLGRWLKGLQ